MERATADELHRVERRAVGPTPCFVHRDDARMLEARRDQCFAKEAQLGCVAAVEQLLHRDVATELAVMRAPDEAEAATALFTAEIVALALASLERRRRTQWFLVRRGLGRRRCRGSRR